MGYANNELSDNFKAVSAMFNGVGTIVDGQKGIYISQIEVVGDDTFTVSKDNVVQIQFLKPNGALDKAYGYHKGDTNRSFKNKGDGWFNSSNELCADDKDVFIPLGQGLWVNGKSASYKFKSSGEVEQDTVQDDLTASFRMLSNPYPTDIKISQIEVTGDETFTVSKDNVVQIQFLKPNGSLDKAFGYHKGDTNRSFKGKGDGWFNSSNELCKDDKDITIPAGTAVWVNGKSADYKLKIVTPFEDAE